MNKRKLKERGMKGKQIDGRKEIKEDGNTLKRNEGYRQHRKKKTEREM
jgi:hypothetical protein